MFECTTFPVALAVQHKVSLHLGDIQEVMFCKNFPPTPTEIDFGGWKNLKDLFSDSLQGCSSLVEPMHGLLGYNQQDD